MIGIKQCSVALYCQCFQWLAHLERKGENFWHSLLTSAKIRIISRAEDQARWFIRSARAGRSLFRSLSFKWRSEMAFRPLHDRVLVRRVDSQDKTARGIIIPDTAKEKPQEGEVVAIGPGVRDDAGAVQPLDVQPGDRILFGKWSGTEVRIDGEDLLIMKESDILGVIEGAAAARAKAA
jgi:chaperonin GroES